MGTSASSSQSNDLVSESKTDIDTPRKLISPISSIAFDCIVSPIPTRILVPENRPEVALEAASAPENSPASAQPSRPVSPSSRPASAPEFQVGAILSASLPELSSIAESEIQASVSEPASRAASSSPQVQIIQAEIPVPPLSSIAESSASVASSSSSRAGSAPISATSPAIAVSSQSTVSSQSALSSQLAARPNQLFLHLL